MRDFLWITRWLAMLLSRTISRRWRATDDPGAGDRPGRFVDLQRSGKDHRKPVRFCLRRASRADDGVTRHRIRRLGAI